MNKNHWNSVKADGEVPDDILKDLLEKSYRIVLGSLSKKKQKEILDMSEMNGLVSCCGSDCSACYCYGDMCKGCNALSHLRLLQKSEWFPFMWRV